MGIGEGAEGARCGGASYGWMGAPLVPRGADARVELWTAADTTGAAAPRRSVVGRGTARGRAEDDERGGQVLCVYTCVRVWMFVCLDVCMCVLRNMKIVLPVVE